MVVYGTFLVKRRPFKIFEQSCEKATARKPETETKVDTLFEVVSKKQARTIGSKIKKKSNFETNFT